MSAFAAGKRTTSSAAKQGRVDTKLLTLHKYSRLISAPPNPLNCFAYRANS
jgi:hypothetical protein